MTMPTTLQEALSEIDRLKIQLRVREPGRQTDAPDYANCLRALIEGTDPSLGSDFFRSLVYHAAVAFRVNCVMIGALYGTGRMRTLAVWARDQYVTNFDSDVAVTPCADVIARHEPVFHERPTGEFFPELKGLDLRTFCGLPVFTGDNQPSGVLVIMDPAPLSLSPDKLQILSLFAARAGAELARQRAEAALQQREEHFRALTEHSLDIISTLGADAVIRYESPSLSRVLGWNPAELIGQNALAFVHPDDVLHVRERLSLVLCHPGVPQSAEFRFRHKDGSWRVLESIGKSLPDPQGEPFVVVNSRDITERRAAEEALRETHRLLATIFDHTHLMLAYLDPSFTFLRVNRAYAEADGRDPSFFVGKKHFDLYPNEEKEAMFRRVLDTGEPCLVHAESSTSRHAGGSVSTYWDWSLVPLKDGQGRVAGLILSLLDVTDRELAYRSLRESEERFASFMRHLPGISFMKDLEGRYIYVNESFESQLGTRPDWYLKTNADLFPASVAAVLSEHDDAAIRGQGPEHVIESLPYPGGSRHWLVSKFPVRLGGSQPFLGGIAVDITDRIRAEDALRQNERELRTVLETLPVGVWFTDAEGKVRLSNPAARLIWASARKAGMGRKTTDQDRWAQMAHAAAPRALTAALTKGEVTLNETMTVECLDGTHKTITTSAVPVRNAIEHVIGAIVVTEDMTDRQRAEAALHQREQDLRKMLEERERISQDLHDGILQSLYAVGLSLEAAKPALRRHGDHATATLEQAIRSLNTVMRDVRNFIAGLDMELLQGGDFSAALKNMLVAMRRPRDPRLRITIDPSAARSFSGEQSMHVLNIVREAVSNSLRHSNARHIHVSVRRLKDRVRLAVKDNGRGFDPKAESGLGHGLVNMAARSRKIGAIFSILSKRRVGTRIVLDLIMENDHARC